MASSICPSIAQLLEPCCIRKPSKNKTLMLESCAEPASYIIIVGGGIIGLCTALQLAEANAKRAQPSPKIVVLEVQESLFRSASSHNTGCIHYEYPEPFAKDLKPLGMYSVKIWRSIAEDNSEFREQTGYRKHSFFLIVEGDGDIKALPDWVNVEDHWLADDGYLGAASATINPDRLGTWLYQQCISLGVEIRTSTRAIEAMISDDGTIKALECLSSRNQETYVLPCEKLVIAAGAWTPKQVKAIFPDSNLDLEPTTLAGDWLLLRNPFPVTQNSIAVVFFNKIVGEKLEFAGRNDSTIWVCGRPNSAAELPDLGKAAIPDSKAIEKLRDQSHRFTKNRIESEKHSPVPFNVIASGRSFRPIRQSGLPIISEVPSDRITSKRHVSTKSSGVFVCYGHGSYGISTGMGSGKLLAQILVGDEPDIELSKFSIH